MDEIFRALDLGGKVTIKVNNRKLLDAMVEIAGAPKQKFKSICSSIDKLDKEPWDKVKRELIEDKGLTEDMANKLGKFVLYKGRPLDLLNKLKEDKLFEGCALKEFEVLFKYIDTLGCSESILFDLSLARGLDYYTGIIYEAVLEGAGLGSVAGGGRYDELVGMFSGKEIPAVGFSIGIERIFAILEKKFEDSGLIRPSETEVIVGSIGKGMIYERMKIVKEFWSAGIKAEIIFTEDPKAPKQLDYALENNVPFITWVGEDEVKNEKIKLKVKCRIYSNYIGSLQK
jgi:histidyl-tRNA synthetase